MYHLTITILHTANDFDSFLMTKLLSTYFKCITFKIGIFYKMHFNPSILISI